MLLASLVLYFMTENCHDTQVKLSLRQSPEIIHKVEGHDYRPTAWAHDPDCSQCALEEYMDESYAD